MLFRTQWKLSIWIAAAIALLLLAGCSTLGKSATLKFSEVSLSSDPASISAKTSVKLIVKIDNESFSKRDSEVQLQINSKTSLPSLIDTVKEGDSYTATYEFPSSGEYAITIHMNYDDEHYAFSRQLKVNE